MTLQSAAHIFCEYTVNDDAVKLLSFKTKAQNFSHSFPTSDEVRGQMSLPTASPELVRF